MFLGVLLMFNYSQASSPTWTVFRLNTNQGHAYEDYLLINISLITYIKN